MSSGNWIPIQTAPPLIRRHTSRYYVNRVRESLHSRISKVICTIFLGFLFFLAIIAFILWLALRPHRPRIHIRDFSISGLANQNGYMNTTVMFNITALNPNQNIGIYYDAMQVNLEYNSQTIGTAKLLYPFFERPHNMTVLYGVFTREMLAVKKEHWKQFLADRDRGPVAFQLKITSVIRFKLFSWRSKRHKMHSLCQAGADREGLILPSYKNKRCNAYFT
ncbi:hypothetical protein NMG60_11009777 [Bertholletia excelsa]